MILGVGVDIVGVGRLKEALSRTPRLKERLFTEEEISYCESKPRPEEHYAARFAVKEALAKALGFKPRWEEAEVRVDRSGRPHIALKGSLAEKLKGLTVHLSLSHHGDYAVAIVVVERRAP